MMRGRLVTGIAVMAAVAAGAVGGAVIGVPGLSAAQPFPSNGRTTAADATNRAPHPMRDPAILDAAAKALDLTTAQLRDKLSDGKTTIADVAKQQNVPIDTVIDAMVTADKARIGDIVNRPWPKFGPGKGFAPGALPGGPGARAVPGIGGGLGRLGSAALDSAAKALGITTDELKSDLAKGQSIADIAKAKNISVDKVIDTLVGDASAKIDQAVKDKHLTQEQADKLKSMLKTVITNLVNNGFPKGMHGGAGFGFGLGGHKRFGGMMPGANGGPTTTTKPPTS
jgi:hypothetical protein